MEGGRVLKGNRQRKHGCRENVLVIDSTHSLLPILHFHGHLKTETIHQGWPIFDVQRKELRLRLLQPRQL